MINGIMDQRVYRDILVDNLQYSADLMGIGDRFVFQQDLDPKHNAPAGRDFFAENQKVMVSTEPGLESYRKLVVYYRSICPN